MPKISVYPRITEVVKGEQIEFAEMIDYIKNGRWDSKIKTVRDLVTAGADEKTLGKAKNELPYFTACGTFKIRNNEGLDQHSGKLAIDFDKIPDDDRPRVWKILIEDKYTEYAFKSCSGRGFCIIVEIDPSKHLESFLYIQKYYKDVYGINGSNESGDYRYFDVSCKDVSRPRYVSSDPDMFHNPEAVTVAPSFFKEFEPGTGQTIDSDEEKFDRCVLIRNKKSQFIEGARHQYMLLLAYFLNKCAVSRSYAEMRFNSDFLPHTEDAKEIKRILDAAYKNTHDYGTYTLYKHTAELPSQYDAAITQAYALAYDALRAGNNDIAPFVENICSTHGIAKSIIENLFKRVFEKNSELFNFDNKSDIEKVELYIAHKFEVYRNEITSRLEFRERNSSDTTLRLLNVDSVYRSLQHNRIKYAFDKLKSLLKSDFVETYNPFVNYFESLPQWLPNEEEDYIDHLASFVKTDNDPFWKTQFKKALVRSIACSVHNIENRIVMVLVQNDQSKGKTRFIRFLCPPKLSEYFTESSMVNDKDSDLQLSENFIWNMEELSALYNNEINKLKAIISRSSVKQRKAYAEHAERHPRRVNFWASTNKTEFLIDDQNTRWLCFNVLSVNHDYNNTRTGVKEVNIDNVWAQAYTLYKQGYDYQLTLEEAEFRDQANKDYELNTTERDLILAHIKPDESEHNFMTNTEILIALQAKTEQTIKLNSKVLSHTMRQLGYKSISKKIAGKTWRGFYCQEISVQAPPQGYNEPRITQMSITENVDNQQVKNNPLPF